MKNKQINYINNNNYSNKSNCRKLCEIIPLFIKTILLITTILYLLNNFVFNISFYISNIPYYTINKIQIWRLFTTSLMSTGIINILLSLALWAKFGSILEDKIGTILYLFIFIINSTAIQILYSILISIFSLIIKNKNILKLKYDNKYNVYNSGIWPYIMCELTLLSLSNPNQIIKLFFFPEIKAKFYPIIVFIIFSLLNNLIVDFEVFCGILYSIIYHFLIKNKLKISNQFIKRIEKTNFIKCFTKFGGFISIKENRFSHYDNSYNKKERNVVVSSNIRDLKDYESFQRSDTNMNIKDINIGNHINSENIISEQNNKDINNTLDIKIQK